MSYVHFPYGPVPKEYSFLLGLMERIGAIRIIGVENGYANNAEVIESVEDYATSETLTAEEIAVLETVLKEFGNLSAKEISERSHREKAYVETVDMELISYKYAMQMD